MDLIAPEVSEYLTSLVPPRHPELLAMEEHAEKVDFPIIGPACGYLCYQVARQIRARSVFELGSGFGYSTAWFARAVVENGGGVVHHVVWDEKLSQKARKHLAALGVEEVVEFHVAEAIATIRAADGPFDLAFLDIDKAGYPDALSAIEQKLRPGGVLIVDNVLWSGRVLDRNDRSAETEAIRELSHRVTRSPDWIASVVPIRDGLLVAYRSKE